MGDPPKVVFFKVRVPICGFGSIGNDMTVIYRWACSDTSVATGVQGERATCTPHHTKGRVEKERARKKQLREPMRVSCFSGESSV